MPVEGAEFISELTPAAPTGGAAVSEGDDELRQLKDVFAKQFSGMRLESPGVELTKNAEELNGAPDAASDTQVIPGDWQVTGNWSFTSTQNFSNSRPILFDFAGDQRLEFDGGTGFDIEFLNKNQSADFLFFTADDPGRVVLGLDSDGSVRMQGGALTVSNGSISTTGGAADIISNGNLVSAAEVQVGTQLRVPSTGAVSLDGAFRTLAIQVTGGGSPGVAYLRVYDAL